MTHKILAPRRYSSAEDDLLGRTEYANNLGDLLATAEAGTVIGLFSPWGAGKTWTLEMIKAHLESKEEVLPIYFGAWDHESENGLLASLFSSLAIQVDENKSFTDSVKKVTRRLAKTALVYGASLGMQYGRLPALIASNGLLDPELIWKAFQNDWESQDEYTAWIDSLKINPHRQMKNDLNLLASELGKQGKKRIVFLVDDLDRCHPENVYRFLDDLRRLITLTSEADLGGGFEGFTGLIAADEEIVRHSIKSKYPDATISVEDYLYKLITVSRRLPSIAGNDLKIFLRDSVDQHRGTPGKKNEGCASLKAKLAIIRMLIEAHKYLPKVVTLRQLDMFIRNYAIWCVGKTDSEFEVIRKNRTLTVAFSLLAQISPRHFSLLKYREIDDINEEIRAVIRGQGLREKEWFGCPMYELIRRQFGNTMQESRSKSGSQIFTPREDNLMSLRLSEEISGFV